MQVSDLENLKLKQTSLENTLQQFNKSVNSKGRKIRLKLNFQTLSFGNYRNANINLRKLLDIPNPKAIGEDKTPRKNIGKPKDTTVGKENTWLSCRIS